MIKNLMSSWILCAVSQAAAAAFALALRLFAHQNVDNRDGCDLLKMGGDLLELRRVCLARFSEFDGKRANRCPGRIAQRRRNGSVYLHWELCVFFGLLKTHNSQCSKSHTVIIPRNSYAPCMFFFGFVALQSKYFFLQLEGCAFLFYFLN